MDDVLVMWLRRRGVIREISRAADRLPVLDPELMENPSTPEDEASWWSDEDEFAASVVGLLSTGKIAERDALSVLVAVAHDLEIRSPMGLDVSQLRRLRCELARLADLI